MSNMSPIVSILTLLDDSRTPYTFMHWRVVFSQTGPRDSPGPSGTLEVEPLGPLEPLEPLEPLVLLEEYWEIGQQ